MGRKVESLIKGRCQRGKKEEEKEKGKEEVSR